MQKWSKEETDYLKIHFSTMQDVEKIANKIGRSIIQVKNKIYHMGLIAKRGVSNYVVSTEILDSQVKKYNDRVKRIKETVKLGSTVKVEIYQKSIGDCGYKIVKGKVIGLYKNIVHVDVGAYKEAFAYNEILEVM